MFKPRAGLPLLLAAVLASAGYECHAAASASYTLMDLGPTNYPDLPPSNLSYQAP